MQKNLWIAVLSLFCIAMIVAAGCTGKSSEQEQKESVHLVLSSNSGTVTVIATNIGHIEEQFDIYIDCYDKDGIKFDGTIVRIPYLKSGEKGKGSAYLPSGTVTYKVHTVGSTSSIGTYRVYFIAEYQ